jgi:hypothetical protein
MEQEESLPCSQDHVRASLIHAILTLIFIYCTYIYVVLVINTYHIAWNNELQDTGIAEHINALLSCFSLRIGTAPFPKTIEIQILDLNEIYT